MHLLWYRSRTQSVKWLQYGSYRHPRERTMKPSTTLEQKRTAIREAAARFGTTNVRVFGSAARGTDHAGSDIDLLVDVRPGTTLFDLGGLQAELEALLGTEVDLVTPADLPVSFRVKVLAEALPV